uniref:Uncharacterized protein n=1 Tax=Glossina austeni TaxID=7395 RepID=A0A1A9VQN1_GLOAU
MTKHTTVLLTFAKRSYACLKSIAIYSTPLVKYLMTIRLWFQGRILFDFSKRHTQSHDPGACTVTLLNELKERLLLNIFKVALAQIGLGVKSDEPQHQLVSKSKVVASVRPSCHIVWGAICEQRPKPKQIRTTPAGGMLRSIKLSILKINSFDFNFQQEILTIA